MKKLLTVLLFITVISATAQQFSPFSKVQVDSLNKLKLDIDFKQTKYKAGFTYYNDRGVKNTLLRWIKAGEFVGIDTYRWRVKSEFLGVTYLSWTDDCWIDLYTDKAYYDRRNHKIVYYDADTLKIAQARHDTSYHFYWPHYPPEESTDNIKKVNYQYSNIEFSRNPHAMTVHTKFNIHNNDSLQFIIEDIEGVEHIDTWQANKYEFLVIVGDMFSPEKIAATIQRRIEYFASPRTVGSKQ